MALLSIIVPCYNEREALPIYYRAVKAVLENRLAHMDYELIFVNDGSRDDTLNVLRAFSQEDKRVRYLSFSRNFGKEAAMRAGFEAARGDYVAVMDCDMQDPPELLADMLDALVKDGYDCAAARRVSRKGEPPIRSAFARAFYKLINRISETEIVDGARDYRMMKRPVVDALLRMGEYHRFSKGMFAWVGFATKWLEYENVERIAGETKWSLWQLFKYAVEGILAFSTFPLRVASFLGALVSGGALIYMLVIVIRTVIAGNPVPGYPSLMAVILALGGAILLSLGVIGEYLARTYMQVKARPIYILNEIEADTSKECSKNEAQA